MYRHWGCCCIPTTRTGGIEVNTKFERNIKDIANLHMVRHVEIIKGLIHWIRPQTVVEVGAYMGFTTCHIAKALQEIGVGELVVIDDFSLHDNHAGNIHNALHHTGVADVPVYIVKGNSHDPSIWPATVNLAVIDGDHSLEGAMMDFRFAMERGAIAIVLHDAVSWWGPRELTDLIRNGELGDWDIIEVPFDSGLAVCIRRTEKPPCTYTKGASV